MRRDLRVSPDMDSTPQDHGVSPSGARPSLLSPASTPSSAPGVRLLDAIDPHPGAMAASTGPRAKKGSKVLWGLTGAALLGGMAAWMASSSQPAASSSAPQARATPSPAPTSAPASAAAQAVAVASAASPTSEATAPAQIIAMATPTDVSHASEADKATPPRAEAANALAAESLAERSAAPPSKPHKAVAKKPSTPNGSSKKTAESGTASKARPKSARQRAEPDPDADVVAAIMASMDRQAAAAAKSAQAASQPGTRRP